MRDLAIAVQLRVPTILWGEPGIGKTSSIYQLGRALDLPTEVVIASIHDPSDFSGLPVPVTDTGDPYVWYAAPDWATRLAKAGKGILFFDEISCASPATQAALLRPILEGVVGSIRLPEKVARVAAANPPELAAGGWNLTPPLANRFCHLHWSVKADRWVEGFLGNWPNPTLPQLPSNVDEFINGAKASVSAFIRARPALLLSVPDNETARAGPWPSPRTWDMASKFIGACNSVNEPTDTLLSLLSGAVGEGPAQEFMVWYTNLDLPQPDYVLAHIDEFEVPDRDDKTFAVLSSIIAYADSRMDEEVWEKCWRIIQKVVEAKKGDIAAVCARTLVKKIQPGFMLPESLKALGPILKMAGRL